MRPSSQSGNPEPLELLSTLKNITDFLSQVYEEVSGHEAAAQCVVADLQHSLAFLRQHERDRCAAAVANDVAATTSALSDVRLGGVRMPHMANSAGGGTTHHSAPPAPQPLVKHSAPRPAAPRPASPAPRAADSPQQLTPAPSSAPKAGVRTPSPMRDNGSPKIGAAPSNSLPTQPRAGTTTASVCGPPGSSSTRRNATGGTAAGKTSLLSGAVKGRATVAGRSAGPRSVLQPPYKTSSSPITPQTMRAAPPKPSPASSGPSTAGRPSLYAGIAMECAGGTPQSACGTAPIGAASGAAYAASIGLPTPMLMGDEDDDGGTAQVPRGTAGRKHVTGGTSSVGAASGAAHATSFGLPTPVVRGDEGGRSAAVLQGVAATAGAATVATATDGSLAAPAATPAAAGLRLPVALRRANNQYADAHKRLDEMLKGGGRPESRATCLADIVNASGRGFVASLADYYGQPGLTPCLPGSRSGVSGPASAMFSSGLSAGRPPQPVSRPASAAAGGTHAADRAPVPVASGASRPTSASSAGGGSMAPSSSRPASAAAGGTPAAAGGTSAAAGGTPASVGRTKTEGTVGPPTRQQRVQVLFAALFAAATWLFQALTEVSTQSSSSSPSASPASLLQLMHSVHGAKARLDHLLALGDERDQLPAAARWRNRFVRAVLAAMPAVLLRPVETSGTSPLTNPTMSRPLGVWLPDRCFALLAPDPRKAAAAAAAAAADGTRDAPLWHQVVMPQPRRGEPPSPGVSVLSGGRRPPPRAFLCASPQDAGSHLRATLQLQAHLYQLYFEAYVAASLVQPIAASVRTHAQGELQQQSSIPSAGIDRPASGGKSHPACTTGLDPSADAAGAASRPASGSGSGRPASGAGGARPASGASRRRPDAGEAAAQERLLARCRLAHMFLCSGAWNRQCCVAESQTDSGRQI